MFDPKAVAEMIVKSRAGAAKDEAQPSGADALRSFAEALKSDDYDTAIDALQAAVQSCMGEGEPQGEV